MVLKKSKSPLNSGSSQKFCNRGAYKKNKKRPTEDTPNLKITLIETPHTYHALHPSRMRHMKALEKVYSYLEINGPSLEEFYISGRKMYSYYSQCMVIPLNERDYLKLGDKMDELIEDKEFLKGEVGLAQVRVHKIMKLAETCRFYSIKSRVFGEGCGRRNWQKKIKRVKKQHVNQHSRGVQRSHLFNTGNTRQNEQYYYDDDYYERDKKVIFELTGDNHIDTRVLCSPDSSTFRGRPKVKSLNKTKSCVNGGHSWFVNGFDRAQIEMDKNDYLSYRCYDKDSYYDWLEYGYDSDTYIDNMSDDNHHRHPLCLSEYVDISINNKRSTSKIKTKSNQSLNKSTQPEMVYVNSASSQTTIKHQKGSFEFITTSSFQNIDEKTEHKQVENHTDNPNDTAHSNIDSGNPTTKKTKKANTESKVTPENFDSKDNFVKVILDIPDINLDKIAKTIPNSNESRFFINECLAVLANIFPPILCIELRDNNFQLNSQWRLVVISVTKRLTMDHLSWYVTLKCSHESVDFERIKTQVLMNLEKNNQIPITLNDLIECAITSIRMNTKTVENNNKTLNVKKNSSDVDMTSVNDYPNVIGVFSLDEAVLKLNLNKSETNSDVQCLNTTPLDTNGDNVAKVSTECDICFISCQNYGAISDGLLVLLPCNHCYCYDCWKSYIFYHIRNGKDNIKCMHTECQQALNSTVLEAIVPQQYINRLRLQQKERMIDVSSRCKWCPKAECDKIAIINDQCDQSIKEFGCSVSCACNSVWCFSCQTKPHIPASCSQAVVYRKILSKMNYDVPQRVTQNVELKPCPGCGYPIEKNEGCPHMTCAMCSMEFCWKCLTPVYDHCIWRCMVDEDTTFSTYKLNNDIINKFPLKLFDISVKIKRKYNNFRNQNLNLWLKSIFATTYKNSKQPFYVSVKLLDFSDLQQKAIQLAEECVKFLLECYNFLQYFNILASFALLNKDFNEEIYKGVSEQSLRRVHNKLETYTSQLEEILVVKKLHHLVMSENRCRLFLQSSREIYHKLLGYVPLLQKLSRFVPTKPYEGLDPIEYFKYA